MGYLPPGKTTKLSARDHKDARNTPNTIEGASVEQVAAPDGGYGWMVLVGSFLCSVILDGVAYTFGLFFVEFLEHFKENKSKTAWVGSVFNGMYMVIGPVVSALAMRYGCRAVTIAGSALAGVAFILSTFATNVNMLILTYGALGGIGFGMIYLPAIVIVGFYFEKRRGFATGIAVSGSGIGAFVFAPLCEWLIITYEWKGAMYIIAAITFNGVAMGALFRPFKPVVVRQSTWRATETSVNDQTTGDSDELVIISPSAVDSEGYANTAFLRSDFEDVNVTPSRRRKWSFSKTDSKPAIINASQIIHEFGTPSLKRVSSQHVNANVAIFSISEAVKQTALCESCRAHFSADTKGWKAVLELKDIEMDDTKRSNCSAIEAIRRKMRVLKQKLSLVVDCSLLTDPVFVVYALSCFLCKIGFYVPFMYLPTAAIMMGIEREKAAFLISVIGITTTVFRVLAGWVADRPWADCLVINNLSLLLLGVSTMLCPFITSYYQLVSYAVVFGACTAVLVSFRSIILVDILDLRKLPNAFGLLNMFQGISTFIGAPMAGALYDVTKHYHCSFYLAGSTIALAGLVCIPLRRLANWQRLRRDVINDCLSLLDPTTDARIDLKYIDVHVS